MPVNTPRKDYVSFAEKWTRCRDCYDGSDAVKERGDKYLPYLDSHKTSADAYAQYQLRALYFNATGRTVEGLTGAVFQKPPQFELKGEKQLEEFVDDITLTGVPAELFAAETTREVLKTGRYGVLVDMADPGEAERLEKERPYWIGYKAEDIVAWRSERQGGDEVLTQVVLRETYEEQDPDDPFVMIVKDQYRVLDAQEGTYVQEIYRKAGKGGEWAKVEDKSPVRRSETLPGIPFVFLGPTNITPEVEKPPLLDLVDVNLSHYRTMADLEHGRHFTALPTPWVSGTTAETGPLSIGSGVAWVLSENGRAGMLEFTGEGLASLVVADQEKRKMMSTLGARLLEEQASSAETATAVGMRHAGQHATLRTVAASIEQGLSLALKWSAWWMGSASTVEEIEVGIELNKEFFAVKAKPEEVKGALALLQADKISYATFYRLIQEGGWAREGIEAEEELKEIQKETEADRAANPEGPEGDQFPEPDPNAAPGSPQSLEIERDQQTGRATRMRLVGGGRRPGGDR